MKPETIFAITYNNKILFIGPELDGLLIQKGIELSAEVLGRHVPDTELVPISELTPIVRLTHHMKRLDHGEHLESAADALTDLICAEFGGFLNTKAVLETLWIKGFFRDD